jgi:hypothetical protein
MRDRGLRVIDPLVAMREAHAGGLQVHGIVDPHLSPKGHEIVERLITEALGETGVARHDDVSRSSVEQVSGGQ